MMPQMCALFVHQLLDGGSDRAAAGGPALRRQLRSCPFAELTTESLLYCPAKPAQKNGWGEVPNGNALVSSPA
jgi:hypothetical protein